jgi:hypothetical protein
VVFTPYSGTWDVTATAELHDASGDGGVGCYLRVDTINGFRSSTPIVQVVKGQPATGTSGSRFDFVPVEETAVLHTSQDGSIDEFCKPLLHILYSHAANHASFSNAEMQAFPVAAVGASANRRPSNQFTPGGS